MQRHETLIVHKELAQTSALNDLIMELQVKGVAIVGGPRTSSLLNIPKAPSLHHEYSSLACTVEIVDDVYAAIDHIHKHGSAHTDCIITEDSEVAEVFLNGVDRGVPSNFELYYVYRKSVKVGVSTSRIHARSPLGVEGLLTTRWIGRGSGHVVNGDKGLVYTHKDLALQD
ncbi:delta-1-pyrroline-5-carboxylate synthase-like isoform X1 [Olea europaea subsp. europaea]|uniref:Delta-1-pyrroline-5-carboxylate synthase-like isoform X1 n=1 Tax=Olea europaea subsp. europaea TaxID=158383 RepID=A0A8S0UUR2_OLEEU|nr:delta-1-pyrroline-5-carboxylate synthase-like isoform X1 [Olea europaea subsp. europaea]